MCVCQFIPGSDAPEAYWPTRGTKGKSAFAGMVQNALLAAVMQGKESAAGGQSRGVSPFIGKGRSAQDKAREREQKLHQESAKTLDTDKLSRVLERDLASERKRRKRRDGG